MNNTSKIVLMLVGFAAIVGCSDSKGKASGSTANPATDKAAATTAPKGEENNKPVTITLYVDSATITELEFQKFFAEPIKKKYPHITMKMLVKAKGKEVQDLLASNEPFPDIIYTSNTSLSRFSDLRLTTDLRDYIKKANLDMSKMRPMVMESLALYSPNNETIALPYTLNFAGWFYNKSILDRFGVAYPRDLMTWDEMLELARKLTRMDSGVQFNGMELDAPDRVGGQLSLPLVDPATNRSVINSEGWKRVMEVMKQNFDMPGYVYGSTYTGFLQKQSSAMMTSWADQMLGPLEELEVKGTPMNWDWVALPNFKEALGTGREVDMHLMILSSQGKNKDVAFQVMSHILSDEVQTTVSKTGRLPVLNNPGLEKLFGEELKTIKGKNSVSNILKAQPRKIHPPHDMDRDVKSALTNAAKAMAVSKKDINTALREAEEAANKKIAEYLAAKK